MMLLVPFNVAILVSNTHTNVYKFDIGALHFCELILLYLMIFAKLKARKF